jgi:hypothetical protein
MRTKREYRTKDERNATQAGENSMRQKTAFAAIVDRGTLKDAAGLGVVLILIAAAQVLSVSFG